MADSCPHDGAPAKPVNILPEGAQVGDYTVARMIGEGGMGAVYEVKHKVISRRAAMKFLRPEYTQKSDVVTRFLQEARAVNVINHDNIINIYDYFKGEDGVVYFVMELLEGQPLTDLLESRGRLPLDLTAHIFAQLMRALSAAHQKNIIHRDLKPDNVFLAKRESDPHFVKLLDFGIARMRGDGAAEGLTQQGSLMGTPQFMSPEQATGQNVDARSDIFSLGVMLYRATVGKRPFTGDNLTAVLAAVIGQDLVPPRQAAPDADIPEALERMILRATLKNPAQRYQSVEEMLHELHLVKAQAGIRDQEQTLSASVASGSARSASAAALASAQQAAQQAAQQPVAADTVVDTPRSGMRTWGKVVVAISLVAIFGSIGAIVAMGGSDDSPQDSAAAEESAASTSSDPPATSKGTEESGPDIAALVAQGKLAEAQRVARSDLEKNLGSDDGSLVRATVEAMSVASTSRVATLFYQALASGGSPQVRLVAARALRDLELPEAAPKVRQAMEQSGQNVRVDLAACLLALGDKEAMAALESALDGKPGAQLTAAEALAMTGGAQGAAERVREILAGALKAPAGRERWRRAARALLALGDESARDLLRGELTRQESERAVAAAEILAQTNDEQAVEWLARVIEDPDPDRASRAALALASIGDARALEYVSQGLANEHKGARTRASAVAAKLARQGGKNHAEAIAALADHDDRTVRLTARVALLAL